MDLETDALPTEPPRPHEIGIKSVGYLLKQIVVYGHGLATLPLTNDETFKMANVAARLN